MASQSSAFELIEADTTRQELSGRSEIKFALPQMDPGKLRRLLEANCRRLIHNGPVSTVRSIYFDDAQLSACEANLSGQRDRRKLRLRWYDSLKPGLQFHFEVKWRKNRVTGKDRLTLRSEEPLETLTFTEIRRRLEATVPDPLKRDLFSYTEPVVIIQYQREHFVTNDGLRLTLDYDLTYYDQVGRRRISTSFPLRAEGLTVLEGKTPLGREQELKRWLHPFTPRAGRCSKYVHGCSRIGLIRENQ